MLPAIYMHPPHSPRRHIHTVERERERETHTRKHCRIQANLCLLTFDPLYFQRNAALQRNAAAEGQTGSRNIGT